MEKSDCKDSANMRMCDDGISLPLTLPAGYRFRPTQEELLRFLHAKLRNSAYHCAGIIEEDVYMLHPKQIVEKYNSIDENALYFFSSRARKYKNGKRPTRTAGEGFWKVTGKVKVVPGSRCKFRTLTYHEGKPPGEKTNWIMHEYVDDQYQIALSKQTNSMKLDVWVLYKIHYNYNKGSKTIKDKRLKRRKSKSIESEAQSPNEGQDIGEPIFENEVVHQTPSDINYDEQVPANTEIHRPITDDEHVINSMPSAIPHDQPHLAFSSITPLATFDPTLQSYFCHDYNNLQYELGECSQNAPPVYNCQFDNAPQNTPKIFDCQFDASLEDFESWFDEYNNGNGADFSSNEEMDTDDETSSIPQTFESGFEDYILAK